MVTALLTFLLSVSSVQAKTCQRIFALKESPQKNVVQLPLNYDLQKHKQSKGNILLIHGLGDDLTQLQRLTVQFKKAGYSVLRVDLHGHGKSLKENIPDSIDYQRNVQDVMRVLEYLQYDNPILIGHSYGAAISYALTAQLKNHRTLKPQGLVMLGPYLRRLDYNFLTGNPLIDAQTEYVSEGYMRQNFRQYFTQKGLDQIDARVDAAIATTRGIRSFDILSSSKRASPQFNLKMLIVGGRKDQAVTVDYLTEFHNKLNAEGYEHQFKIIDGDHFFPQTNSQRTAKVILEFLKGE